MRRVYCLFICLVWADLSIAAQSPVFCWNTYRALSGEPLDQFRSHLAAARREIQPRLRQKAEYPDVPSVDQLHLPTAEPQRIKERQAGLSPGLKDPLLEEARQLMAVEDFKTLSDRRPKPLTREEKNTLIAQAEAVAQTTYETSTHLAEPERRIAARRAFLHQYLQDAYTSGGQLKPEPGLARARWTVNTGRSHWDKAFDYTEDTLPELVQRTPDHRDGSLLPSPYPVLIAAKGRFHESYYWDTYFGVKGLLATGRLELAQMQVENFLHAIRRYGIIPNGMRDYYLSRSQPPFVSSLVREVVEAQLQADPSSRPRVLRWLKERALPLIERDYEKFWMNPETRYDSKTGLNHHWDGISFPRPERHGFDVEESLGETYRDVRAAAESGLDFTALHNGRASRLATPLLNSMLYKTETDLAWMAKLVGESSKQTKFQKSAARRKKNMEKMWNEKEGRYEHLDLETLSPVDQLSAETFVPLFAGMLDPAKPTELARIRRLQDTLKQLERPGGIAASNATDSPHQWDGNNGWAPFQVMAVAGFQQAGPEFQPTAKRLATKWADTIALGHAKHGAMFERMDVVAQDRPEVDETKYPTQRGFLWTNGSYVWMLKEVLGTKLIPKE